MFARIRKAVIAGSGAGVAAVVAMLPQVLQDAAVTGEEFGMLAGAFAAALATVGWATWRVPNKPE
jgi:sugar (pentulose or hexulose) kinase